MEKIPIVDCSAILGSFDDINEDGFNRVAKDLGAAMGSIGFAYVINHGVDIKKVNKLYDISQDFFQLSEDIKRKYRKQDPSKCFHGYAGPGEELLNESVKNSTELREFFDIWGPEQRDESKWPEEIPEFKAAFEDFRNDASNCAKKLLFCLAKYLKLEDEEFFLKRHRNLDDLSVKTQTDFRSLYYYTLNPDDKNPSDAIRCGEHSDWGSITMLFQDMIGGLEVRTSSGKWIQAEPVKDAILLNSGQLMELWTAGKLHAAMHRVRILTKGRPAIQARQSLVYFVNPDADVEVFPIVPIEPEKKELYAGRSTNAFDYFEKRAEYATY